MSVCEFPALICLATLQRRKQELVKCLKRFKFSKKNDIQGSI